MDWFELIQGRFYWALNNPTRHDDFPPYVVVWDGGSFRYPGDTGTVAYPLKVAGPIVPPPLPPVAAKP